MAEFCYSQIIFVINNIFIDDSEAYHLVKLYFETSHLEPGRATAVELFCRNSQRVKTVGYFRRRALLWMFNRILNVTLPNNLL